IAIRSTGRMQRLINTLLDIYRLEAGQPITSRAMTEIAPLVYEAVDTILPVAENKGQQVDVQIEPNLPPLNIDADMIRRVLINLLDNATKYTLFKGKITLSVYRKGERVEFAVRDNGPGIPPDALEVIFDKFARLQSERFPKGIGLGLAFCRLAVRSHGGEIWVESKLNEGSCFTFALPIPQTEDGLSMKNN
ncbi:sensor histidine kinase, partial [Anaerolinea sp.]